ncbi:hypothetical protein QBC35DRAFT_477992 [Podospora australis]|uniref:Uncharacterized protein n=1 Tax=Podospora australis TaxID=1536484 RepID=A0AAN7ACJ5_9PEZI|nr:hypothetical protein QBC35DRAFT_477992 [Podospora australis]
MEQDNTTSLEPHGVRHASVSCELAPLTPTESSLSSRPEFHRAETSLTGVTLLSRQHSVSDGAPTAGNLPRKKSYGQASCSSKSFAPHELCAASQKESTTTGIHSKLFQTLHDQPNALFHSENLSAETNIDLLRISCEEGVYLPGQNTKQVETALSEFGDETCGCPRLLALFIKLKRSPSATFRQRASISPKLVERLFVDYDIHNSFLGDLIGRPDYWSAVGRAKGGWGNKTAEQPASAFEFFCQHPRWAQSSRYEKGRSAAAMQGHRAPCSVYMHHSRTQNLTLYLVAASESEDWFPSLLDRIGVLDCKGLNTSMPSGETRQALASSPFMLHTILSTVAFEQSIEYVAKVRDRLMTQIKQVNDYSDQSGNEARKPAKDRAMLEQITKELHSVSQTADTGLANAHMSIKIAERMLEAHSMFMMGRERLHKGPAAAFIRDTHQALEYARNSFYCQKDWLSSYKARKDTAMNFVFNVVTQHDSATNVDISYRMAKDSSSMNAVTILTLIFLPGTFLSVGDRSADGVLKRCVFSERNRGSTNDRLVDSIYHCGLHFDGRMLLSVVFSGSARPLARVCLAESQQGALRGKEERSGHATMGSALELDELTITENFDRGVEEGTIIYNKDFRTVGYSDNGFSFEFRLLTGLDRKPTPSSPPQSSGCRPGSDIDVSGYEVADLGSTHLVAFNKFASARPHLLVLTQDGYRRQHEPLNIDDLTALRHVLLSLADSTRRYMAIFNCGIDSGCSRLHKHMQVFPVVPGFPLWPDSEDSTVQASVPFQCFVHRLNGDELPSAEEVTAVYTKLLDRAKSALAAVGYPLDGEVPHNLILDRKWIVVVPRRQAGVNGADANAAAFLGMVWVSDEVKMKRWTEQGPANVLSQIALPAPGRLG